MSERITSVGLFRPVLNIEQRHIDELQLFATENNFKKLRLMDNLSFGLLGEDEVGYFYRQAGYQPEEVQLEELPEYLENCLPETVAREIDVPTWPATVTENDTPAHHSWRRLEEVLYLGTTACIPAFERKEFKSIVANFGDKYGPLYSTWPNSRIQGVQLGAAYRSHHDRSQIRRYSRLLRNARILPEVLVLGGVEMHIEKLNVENE